MHVLSDIAGRAIGSVDAVASRWLHRLGGETAPAALVATLRRIALSGAVAFIALPLALCLVMKPALALPVGAALVVAVVLILSAVAFAALGNLSGQNAPAVAENSAEAALLKTCAGLTLMLDLQGRIVDAGGRDRHTFPEILADGIGGALADCVHVSDRIALAQAIDSLRQGGDCASADIRVERKVSASLGRQFMHIGVDLSAIRAEGELARIFAQLRDRSGEEQQRQQIESLAEEAQSAHEAKSRFLAAVSHELRTPLNAILGFSDVLAGEYFGKLANDRQREYVGLIRQSGGHLLSVVNTMLDMSKIEAGRYELITEPFAVSDAVETCRAMLDHSAREKGVTLTARAPRQLGEIVADRRAIQQILINLAGNAIKFTDRGGVVSIDAVLQGGKLVISVSDTGIGIAEDKLAFVGQPFNQVQNDYTRQYEGTGLGLSLVKGLVALHGGTFAIASRKGEGTVVTITVPADGSGVGQVTEDVDACNERVEFPPRLMLRRSPANGAAGQAHQSGTGQRDDLSARIIEAATTATGSMNEQKEDHGTAKAKIA